jgi:hypothetical protein
MKLFQYSSANKIPSKFYSTLSDKSSLQINNVRDVALINLSWLINEVITY